MHKSRRITVNLERALSLSYPIVLDAWCVRVSFPLTSDGATNEARRCRLYGSPRTATPSKGRKERARISLSLSLPPFLEEQCDVAPHSSRSNVLVSPPVARIVCTRFLLCETGMVAMRCDAVRFGYGVVSTAPVCRQFSGGRPASPVVA